MDASGYAPLSLAGLAIDPARRRVTGPGGEAVIEPLVMRLLLELVDREGEVLPRRELFNRLWGNAQVGDDSLNRAVGNLRRALDRTSEGEVLIETVPRVGYRLTTSHAEAGSGQRTVGRRALLMGGAAMALAVVGAAILRLRTERELTDAKQWTDRGDVLLRDAVPLQAGAALPPLRKAMALDPRSSRALGLMALAEETSAYNGGSANPADSLRHAETCARDALQRDPGEPHARLAMLDLNAGRMDWSEIEDGLQALLGTAPDNLHVLGSLTSFLQAAGLTRRSWPINERAAAAAPSSPTPQWRRVLRLWTAGRTQDALALSERLMPLWPSHALVWNARFMVLAYSGRTAAAAEMLGSPASPAANAHPILRSQWEPTLAALADPSQAKVAQAREANLAAAQRSPGQATYAAMTLSALGEVDAAYLVIDALLRSKGPLAVGRPVAAHSFVANAPSWCRTQWLFMPPLVAVRQDARFEGLCDDLGLTRYWRKRGVTPDTFLPS